MGLVSPFQLVLNLRIKIQFHLPLEGLSAQLMRIRNFHVQFFTKINKATQVSVAISCNISNIMQLQPSRPRHAAGTPPARRPHRPEHPTSAEAHPGYELWASLGFKREGESRESQTVQTKAAAVLLQCAS